MVVVHIFFTIYIEIFTRLVSISRYYWYPWAVVCILLHCLPAYRDLIRCCQNLSIAHFMVSLREYEGRYCASLARAWQRLQAVRR